MTDPLRRPVDAEREEEPGGVPHWVRNVSRRPAAGVGLAVRRVRGAYRVVGTAAALALWPLLAWSWLAEGGAAVTAARWATSIAALVVAPLLWLRWANPSTTLYMFSTRRGLWPAGASPRPLEHEWVGLENVAPAMCLAVLVSEDPYFFWHFGFNPVEIVRALRYNRHEREPGRMLRGGSTISQQVAKNLFLLPSQSYVRKAIEALLTAFIEALWPKRRILEVYLNVVQFGDVVFGVEAAARRFFGVPASALAAEQAALLTAALRRPQIYRVEAPPPTMRELQAEILRRMEWCGEGMLAQLGERARQPGG